MHIQRASLNRASFVILAAAIAFSPISCAKKKDAGKPVYPVTGKVVVNDEPAVGAFVVFVPVNEPAEPVDPRPHAFVDQSGVFRLSTFGENDGAPAGDYLVIITWPGGPDEPEDKLNGRYATPAAANLRVTVRQGPTEIEVLRLR